MPEAAECALFAKDITDYLDGDPISNMAMFTKHCSGEKFKIFKSNLPFNVFWDNDGDRRDVPFKIASYGKILEVQIGERTFHVRLGMTGRFLRELPEGMGPHGMAVWESWKSGKKFWYVDPRRFSTWREADHKPENWILSWDGIGKHPHIGNLHGIVDRLGNSYTRKPRMTWLLGTGPETGIGNYLANEALGRLDLNPFEKGKSNELYRLLETSYEIAADSFASGGNSFGGGYYRFSGDPGGYQDSCKFYKNPELVRSTFRGRVVYSRFTAPS